jgi:hypothetical protein
MRCPSHPKELAVNCCTVCSGWSCESCAPIDSLLNAPVCSECRSGVRSAAQTIPATNAGWRVLVTALVLMAALVVGMVAWQRLDPSGMEDRAYRRAYAALEETGLALERFRQREGEYPTSLHELVPDDLSRLPTDPFAGRAQILSYRGAEYGKGRILLYSVGPDGGDHGGLVRDPVTGRGDLSYPVD